MPFRLNDRLYIEPFIILKEPHNCFCCISYFLICSISIAICLRITSFYFSFDFSLEPWYFGNILYNFKLFVYFPRFLFAFESLFYTMWL